MEKMTTSESILGHHLPNFETLDAKIAHALKKILPATDFRNKHTQVTLRTEAVNPTCEFELHVTCRCSLPFSRSLRPPAPLAFGYDLLLVWTETVQMSNVFATIRCVVVNFVSTAS